MSGTEVLIAVVIVVVVLLVVAGLLVSSRNRKRQQAREQAERLRADAAGVAAVQPEQAAQVREKEAAAAQARAEAERLEQEAHTTRTDYDMTRAQQEDAVREADRLDPDVDHRAADYRPSEPAPPTPSGAATGSKETTEVAGGSHESNEVAEGSHESTEVAGGREYAGEPRRTDAAAPGTAGQQQGQPGQQQGQPGQQQGQPGQADVLPTDPHDPDFDAGHGGTAPPR